MESDLKPQILIRRRRFSSPRRIPRYSVFRILVCLFLIYDSLHTFSLYLRQTASLHAPPPPRNSKRIYIAAQHWNSERLLREHWNAALFALVQELGIENVFVAIYESGSYDDTKVALRELDSRLEDLHVDRDITLSPVSHADEITKLPTEHGWINTTDGQTELRRIPFLASTRNHVFRPLEALTARGVRFDTILFLNDVVFTPEDVLKLLDTNGGDFAAACSLDFAKPPHFYDTFALRDAHGHEALMQTWPYFRSYPSRHAAERFLPVPVASCWNGMVAMPIKSFLGDNPLRFRGIPDSLASAHVEGSECCLIHADNPLSASRGVFLNPDVRVGYNGSAYEEVHRPEAIMTPLHMYMAIWHNRMLRMFTTPLFKEWTVHSRVKAWAEQTGGRERGEFCLINEMQIVMEWGWRHV
ncbi:glycosyltransferase family 69 protein [Dothidotthia symphoricarpi CBS 119687]|uniref:Glycosyltransferase family 69 protein n=1 Tax=Dothidotthia symphoricarpi CBS 119687 TaxID=1392245 RepID=A0A6A6AJ61_9PLEO|nr:glycosyltransferase family 69 protein [Dothidotthia symphoricarpi CBS 119687]KAF2132012.1 glycosyltransferase family 69 protein [Dothidotthia symphoricarpi CBS 119687]